MSNMLSNWLYDAGFVNHAWFSLAVMDFLFNSSLGPCIIRQELKTTAKICLPTSNRHLNFEFIGLKLFKYWFQIFCAICFSGSLKNYLPNVPVLQANSATPLPLISKPLFQCKNYTNCWKIVHSFSTHIESFFPQRFSKKY